MTPLCSIVCPTRHRLPVLRRMIASIMDTCDTPSRIEIILRIHTDDTDTLWAIPELVGLGPVRIAIGHPMRGWQDLTRFYEEALALAKGDWVWIMNDDVVCETKGWDTFLANESVYADTIIMPNIR